MSVIADAIENVLGDNIDALTEHKIENVLNYVGEKVNISQVSEQEQFSIYSYITSVILSKVGRMKIASIDENEIKREKYIKDITKSGINVLLMESEQFKWEPKAYKRLKKLSNDLLELAKVVNRSEYSGEYSGELQNMFNSYITKLAEQFGEEQFKYSDYTIASNTFYYLFAQVKHDINYICGSEDSVNTNRYSSSTSDSVEDIDMRGFTEDMEFMKEIGNSDDDDTETEYAEGYSDIENW